MKHRIIILSIVCCICTTLFSQVLEISKLGAKNDGVTDNTSIIQQAIDSCNTAGGGTVLISGGGKYVSGTLFLKSFVTLHVSNGTTLLASPRISDYSDKTYKNMYKKEPHMNKCFIYAENQESISIEGVGTIDGNGDKKNFSKERPMLLRIKDCNHITLKDITLKDPAAWTSAWLYCNDISVSGIRISSRVNNNGDGLDFDGCENVRVTNSSFDTSDDCICLQTSRVDRPCRKVTINNCNFISKWAGIRIGLLSMAEISSVAVSNCSFSDISDAGLKIQQNEGGCMSDMVFDDLVMNNVPRPIFMTFCKQRACVDAPQDKLDALKFLRNITFNNIIVNNEQLDKNSAIIISGIPGYYIQNISMNNINFRVSGGGNVEDAKRRDIPEFDLTSMKTHWPEYTCLNGALPSYGLYLRHIDGIDLSNITVKCINNDKRKMMRFIDVKNMTKSNLK